MGNCRDLKITPDRSSKMHLLLFFMFAGLYAFCFSSFTGNQPVNPTAEDGILFNWRKFKSFHGKEYDGAEDAMRRKAYIKNSQRVDRHNKEYLQGLHSYKLKINHFADMAPEVFRTMMHGIKFRNNDTSFAKNPVFLAPSNVQLPETIDWRQRGFVTPVKNQGQCGSCWAFSSTGALEGQHFRKTGRLISLSEQQLVDCSWQYGNQGCSGGFMTQAFDYIKDNNGVDTETSYPYEAKEDSCHFRMDTVGATDYGHVYVLPEGNEEILKTAVATVGPISIAMDASHETFQTYSSGVYDEDECSSDVRSLNHAMLIVGYGNENGKDYWLVKNSWGEEWGDDGYIKMVRNKNNQCGIATAASYPLV